MAEKEDSSKDNKVFDVAEPQDSKLDIGSKPMVIGHKNSADPTLAVPKEADVETNEVTNESETSQESATPSKRIKIEPLSDNEKTAPTKEENTQENDDSKETQKEEKPEEAKADDTSTAVNPATEPETKERDFVAEAENQEQSAQDAESEREEKVEELRKSKKYYVSVKEKHDTAFGKILALIFAILISIFGVYALADAGVIPGGELLPMRFIGEEEKPVETTDETTKQTLTPVTEIDEKQQTPTLLYKSEEVSEDLSKFTLEQPAISFNYPTEFGEAKLVDEATTEGRAFFNFTKNSNYSFVLNIKDREGPTGHDSPTLNLQSYETVDGETQILYLTPESTNKSALTDANILVEGESYVIFETAGIAYVFAGVSMITNSAEYESIVFDYGLGSDSEAFKATDPEVQTLKEILDTLQYGAQQ